jgi:SAM-dependent methyltransferase
MNVAVKVREIYEEHPYPAIGRSAATRAIWRLAPMKWINALWQPTRAFPQRILVAGCGTGNEAFAWCRSFPRSDIVAVDFSPQSVAIARHLQRRAPQLRRIRFLVGDLAAKRFTKIVGQDFDFVSCHGVLSYVAKPERVLENLARCLNADGALYLGVNGAQHHSVCGRQFLPAFGFDMVELRESSRLRKVLKLCDAILGNRGAHCLANKPASYLAGDLFGPLIQNLPLSDWISMARDAGLYFQSSYGAYRGLRYTMEQDFPQLLIPRSRGELCELVEKLAPTGFHRILFTRRPPVNPPWQSRDAFLAWRPILTKLYSLRLPKPARRWQALRVVTMKSPSTDTRLDWRMPEWELEILRRSDGNLTLREILQAVAAPIRHDLLQKQLYQLHQLLIINLSSMQS